MLVSSCGAGLRPCSRPSGRPEPRQLPGNKTCSFGGAKGRCFLRLVRRLRNFFKPCLRLRSDPCSGFADHQKSAQHGVLRLQIFEEVLTAITLDVALDRFSGAQNIEQVGDLPILKISRADARIERRRIGLSLRSTDRRVRRSTRQPRMCSSSSCMAKNSSPGAMPGTKVTIRSRSLPAEASPVATDPNTSTRAMPWRRQKRRKVPGYLVDRRRRNRICHGGPLKFSLPSCFTSSEKGIVWLSLVHFRKLNSIVVRIFAGIQLFRAGLKRHC